MRQRYGENSVLMGVATKPTPTASSPPRGPQRLNQSESPAPKCLDMNTSPLSPRRLGDCEGLEYGDHVEVAEGGVVVFDGTIHDILHGHNVIWVQGSVRHLGERKLFVLHDEAVYLKTAPSKAIDPTKSY